MTSAANKKMFAIIYRLNKSSKHSQLKSDKCIKLVHHIMKRLYMYCCVMILKPYKY